MVGQDNPESQWSASHGAGDVARRPACGHEAESRAFLERFRLVTPVDFRRADLQMWRDILDKKFEKFEQEATHFYKGIRPIVESLMGAGIARLVAELSPLSTIKA